MPKVFHKNEKMQSLKRESKERQYHRNKNFDSILVFYQWASLEKNKKNTDIQKSTNKNKDNNLIYMNNYPLKYEQMIILKDLRI